MAKQERIEKASQTPKRPAPAPQDLRTPSGKAMKF